MNDVYLSGKFSVYSVPDLVYRLELYHHGLEISVLSSNEKHTQLDTISTSDIVGCSCLRYNSDYMKNVEAARNAYLSICYYKLKETKLRGAVRKRFKIILEISSHKEFHENLLLARKWKLCILYLVRDKYIGSARTALSDVRKLLILINPKSGSGKALSLFKNQALPILNDSGVPFDYYITKKSFDALNQIRKIDLSAWRGIIVASGDGLLFEVYNGLYARDDWESCMSFPIGIIPCGSGNGLARSVAHVSGEPYTKQPITVSTLSILSGKSLPMDLVHVETEDQKYCAFLSIGWGMLADIDIESEKLRMIGESRFTAYAVTKILNMKLYSGQVSYLPANPAKFNSTFPEEDINIIKRELEKIITNTEVLYDTACDKHIYKTNSLDELSNDLTSNNDGLNYYLSRRMTIPPLTAAVPNEWLVVKAEFLLVYAVIQTHIGTDAFFAPQASLDDGVIWLFLVTSQATRMEMVQFFTGLGTGDHINCPNTMVLPVKAFRLEPNNQRGNMVVDGESVRYGKLQAEIWPSKGRILTR